MGTGCILINGDPTQFFIKMGAENKSFVCNNVRWKQKIRKIAFLRKRGIYRPSPATFSMKRFFLTSVYEPCHENQSTCMSWVHNKGANQHAHPCIRISAFIFAQTVITLTNNGFIIEPRHEKPCLSGSRPGPTQTELYNRIRWLEA